MVVFYRWMALFGILMAGLVGTILLISVVQQATEQERALRGIEMAIWWLVALVALGNLNRLELAGKK